MISLHVSFGHKFTSKVHVVTRLNQTGEHTWSVLVCCPSSHHHYKQEEFEKTLKVKVKCHQNLISAIFQPNTYSYQVMSISDQQFFSVIMLTHRHGWGVG